MKLTEPSPKPPAKASTTVVLTLTSIPAADADVPANNRLRRLLKAILGYGFRVTSVHDVRTGVTAIDPVPGVADGDDAA